MTKARIIDAGRSDRGWSRVGNFFKCPQLFAYGERIGVELIPADPLLKGSLGHLLQAHLHGRWGAAQGGCWVDNEWVSEPEQLLAPEEAATIWAEANGAQRHLPLMLEIFDAYLDRFPEPPGRILAVEHQITGVLGTDPNGEWGLWDRDNPHITPTPLDMPGHPDHGKPITLTRRVDLTIRDGAGRAWVWDHKHQARVNPGKSVEAYAIDGGFTAFRILGRQVWDNFGGLALNLIQTRKPWKVARVPVPFTPWRDTHFAEMLWRAEHEIARLDIDGTDHWCWPKAQHETTCFGRYGGCSALRLCMYGKSEINSR